MVSAGENRDVVYRRDEPLVYGPGLLLAASARPAPAAGRQSFPHFLRGDLPDGTYRDLLSEVSKTAKTRLS